MDKPYTTPIKPSSTRYQHLNGLSKMPTPATKAAAAFSWVAYAHCKCITSKWVKSAYAP